MKDIAIPTLRDEDDNELNCFSITGAHEEASVSAISPSGLALAIGVECTTEQSTALSSDLLSDNHHRHQTTPVSPRRDSLDSRTASERATSSACPSQPVSQYRVVIATDKSGGKNNATASTSRSSSNRSAETLDNIADTTTEVFSCPVKAPVTALQWLDDTHLVCGSQDGTVSLLTRKGSSATSSQNATSSPSCVRHTGIWTQTLSRCFHRVAPGAGGAQNDQGRRRVVRITVSGEEFAGGVDGFGRAGGGVGGSVGGVDAGAGQALTLWVLYEDRVVVCVSADALTTLASKRTDSVNTASADDPSSTIDQQQLQSQQPGSPSSSAPVGPSFAKLQLEGQDEILDVAACPAPAGLFEIRQDRHSHVILAAGVSPALAFYPVGSESRSIGLASIAWAVASRVTSLTVGAIDGIFGLVSFRGRGRRRKAAEEAAAAAAAAASGGEDGEGRDESPPPLVLRWDGGLQDGRRRVSRLCLDPSGRLAAAADGFGRVLLVDCATRQILRMWKGVRDAQCGWLEVEESWEGQRACVGINAQAALDTAAAGIGGGGNDGTCTPVVGLYLAILAPLRGRVELWRMRHGQCVRVVPAPPGSRLVTSKPTSISGDVAPDRMDGRGVNDDGENGGFARGESRRDRDRQALTSCYLLSGGGGKSGEAVTRLRLSPLLVEEADLAALPSRLSRAVTMDDNYRLREFFHAVAETKRSQRQQSPTENHPSNTVSRGGNRLPAGREAREEHLLGLISQLESVETLARAMLALGGRRVDGVRALGEKESVPGAVSAGDTEGNAFSASFHRRVCDLCRERADKAATSITTRAAIDGEADSSTREPQATFSESLRQPPPPRQGQEGDEKTAAIAALRFRANAHELYTLLQSVEVQPAGVAGEGEDGDPAFLPPGKRGWKHGLLCEEAAGWAQMTREGGGAAVPSRGTASWSVDLPGFQDFLDTVSLVLELPETPPRTSTSSRIPSGGNRHEQPGPLLRFIESTGDGVTKAAASAAPISRSRLDAGDRETAPGLGTSSGMSTAGSFAPMHAGSAQLSKEHAERAECRKLLVGWLFRPLLSDAFAMASLTEALALLGVAGKAHGVTLVRDMSAWFLALPVGRAADITVGREAQNCPVLRWLKGVIMLAVSEDGLAGTGSGSGPPKGGVSGSGLDASMFGGGGGAGRDEDSLRKEKMSSVFGVQSGGSGGLFGDESGDEGGGPNSSGRKGSVDGSGGVGVSSRVEKGDQEEGEDDENEDEEEEDEEDMDVDTNDDSGNDSTDDFHAETEAVLRPMYEACAASQMLENAAMLSVVTAEALSACRERLQESSLGRVVIGGGEAWVDLARRLRMCLFFDHRLHSGILAEQARSRKRASVRQFEEGKVSVYSFVAKDQLLSTDDLSFVACAARESAEMEASVRSQRETAEARASAAKAGPDKRSGGGGRGAAIGAAKHKAGDTTGVKSAVVAAAPSLADGRMDEYWREVQAAAARQEHLGSRQDPSPSSASFSLNLAIAGLSSIPTTLNTAATIKPMANNKANTADDKQRSEPGTSRAKPKRSTPAPTSLFFMRSHAEPIVLACHRARWLVRSWASTGPLTMRALGGEVMAGELPPTASVAEKASAAEGAVRLLSLAVDHIGYLRTAKPFLAGCVAYWLWEHEGVRAHVGELLWRGSGKLHSDGNEAEQTNAADSASMDFPEVGRPAREAFLAAAEEFLHMEALFPASPQQQGPGQGGWRGSGGGSSGGKRAAEVSFVSQISAGAVQRCPWPGAWDLWLEECLRDAQVRPPHHAAVTAHVTLLRVLRVSTICGLPEDEARHLFLRGGELCEEAALHNDRLATQVPDRGLGVDGDRIVARREEYIRRALEAIVPRPAQNIYRLARDFGIAEDDVRGWHCLVLLRRGHDVLGEEAMAQVYSLQNLAPDVLTIMRLRLKHVLDYLERSPKASGALLARLDADTCQWVRTAKDVDAFAGAGAEKGREGGGMSVGGEPLRSTHGVLLCLARALPPDSRYKLQANALLTLVGTMLR